MNCRYPSTAGFALALLLASPIWAASVSGRVTVNTTSQPPVDYQTMWVQVANGDGSVFDELAADGSYLIGGVEAGTYELTLRHGVQSPYVLPPAEVVTLTADQALVRDFALVPYGRIQGTVRRGDGSPVAGATVRAATTNSSLSLSLETLTGADGSYDLGPLPDAPYQVRLEDFGELWGKTWPEVVCGRDFGIHGIPCPDGEVLQVAAGPPLTGIDFTMRPGGRISGRLLDENGQPFPDATVSVYNQLGELTMLAPADAAGAFTVLPLPPARYYLVAQRGFDRFVHPDLPCDGSECEPRFGQPFPVDAEHPTYDGVEMRAPARLPIRFRALDAATGQSLDQISWRVVDADSGEQRTGYGVGTLLLNLLPGRYFVDALGTGYQREGLGGMHLRTTELDELATSQSFEVGGDQPDEYTLELDPAGGLKGRMTVAGAFHPACYVVAFSADLPRRRDLPLGPCHFQGEFRVDAPPGRYHVLIDGGHFANTPNRAVLAGNIPCVYSFDRECAIEQSPVVEVTQGADTSLGELRMPSFGAIRGQIDLPFEQSGRLLVYTADGRQVVTHSVQGGSYELQLIPGFYRLVYAGEPPAGRQLYPGLPCPPAACDLAAGTPIQVTAFATTTGIDFAPPPAPPLACTGADQCLTDRRFQVKTRWTDPQGQQGVGQQVGFDVEDTAFYYFFSGDNIELMVKVLDACYPPFDRFWVFSAGTTNVGVEIEVTDTVTGLTKTYTNPLGQHYRPILDTDAFPCDGGPSPAPHPAASAFAGPPSAARPLATLADLRPAPAYTTICDDQNAICQDFGHFRLDATWQTPDGSGPGLPDWESGAFYFFSPNNLELMTKVLDGCRLNGHYWVFGAGLTNVGVELRVTDTRTDRQKVYSNPYGTAFAPILDTSAFPCWR